MNWLETTAQISQIAAVISVIFAAYSIRSNTKLSHRQWNVDTFTTYSERHKAAIAAFPDNAFYNRLDPEKLPPRSPALSRAVLNYLFVICDVHYLAYQKIPRRLHLASLAHRSNQNCPLPIDRQRVARAQSSV